MRKHLFGVAVGAVALSALVAGSQAQAASTLYTLFDHPGGLISPPPYGLRYDETGETFSVSTNGANVQLEWNQTTNVAVIRGELYNNDVGDLWDVEYTMTGAIAANGGFVVELPDNGTGTLSQQVGVLSYNLNGKADQSGAVFELFNDGWRLDNDNSTLVGRGWLEGETYSDWLVQAQVVPIPAALPLFATALAGFGFLRWRKKKAA